MNAQASSERVSLLGLTPAEFSAALEQSCDAELPRYRAEQVFEWVYRHRVGAFDQMTNLPADLQRLLARSCIIEQSDIAHQLRSADGTHKLLLRWSGGGTSECVLIPSPQRVTGCISTQVGCPVRCTFCASGIDGLKRNLSAGEIVEQAWRLSNMSEQLGQRLSNVVFMGLGEPLANFDATVRALRIINADWGLAIGARKITVSTVGLPRQMKMLADQELQITLALSLHAPTDELRRQLIPWAERVTIDELVDACRYYFERTGREVTIEFILLAGVNDAAHHAEQLATLSKRMRSNVNLIPYNEVAGIGYRRPGDKSVAQFAERLKQQGVNCHVRRSRGRDIDAACGQLRRRVAAES